MYWQYQKDKNEFEKIDLSFDEIRNQLNEIGFFNVSINNENELFTYINLNVNYCKFDLTRYFH